MLNLQLRNYGRSRDKITDKKSKSIIATTIFAIMLVCSFVNFFYQKVFIPTKNHSLAWINLIGMITTVVPLLVLTISSFVYKRKNILKVIKT